MLTESVVKEVLLNSTLKGGFSISKIRNRSIIAGIVLSVVVIVFSGFLFTKDEGKMLKEANGSPMVKEANYIDNKDIGGNESNDLDEKGILNKVTIDSKTNIKGNTNIRKIILLTDHRKPVDEPDRSSATIGTDLLKVTGATATVKAVEKDKSLKEGVRAKTQEVDKSKLKAIIINAKASKATIKVSIDGKDILPTQKWVTGEVMVAYIDAIKTVQRVADHAGATQTEVEQAVSDLSTAINKFNAKKQAGTRLLASKIKFTITELKRAVGESSIRYKARGAGDGAITYTSEDPEIASVDTTGLLTVHKVGTTIITATQAESKTYQAGTATYKVTVEEMPDTAKLAADKALIEAESYEIPLENQTNQAAKTKWLQEAVDALIENGTRATVSWNGASYHLALALNVVENTAKITVTEEAKITPITDNIVATDLEAGQILADSTLNGTFKRSAQDGTIVPGTLEWTDDTIIVRETGDFSWTFTPNNTDIYNVITGQVTIPVSNDFDGGIGTKADPYRVSNAKQLNLVRKHLDKHFIQISDIDLGLPPYDADEGWVPIGEYSANGNLAFKGSYNGGDYEISGLTISRSEKDYQGLFAATKDTAELSNISLTEVDILALNDVGGLVGVNNGTITNSYVSGSITGEGVHIGGLVGSQMGGNIHSSYSAVGSVVGARDVGGLVGNNMLNSSIIESYATTSVTDGKDGNKSNFGGLVGRNSGDIENSYATGSVKCSNYAGGLVGVNSGKIYNSYATGSVQGNNYLGGLVGENSRQINNSYAIGLVSVANSKDKKTGGLVGNNKEDGNVVNSYYDTQTTGQIDTGKGIGKKTTEMVDANILKDWNLGDIWIIGDSNSFYPYLKWQRDNFPLIPVTPPSHFAGGSGTKHDPYQVSNADQLNKVRDYLEKHFEQIADIDLDIDGWNADEGWIPIGNNSAKFTGSYNGTDYKVSGLFIDRPTSNYQGLFGSTDLQAELKNITLIGVKINGNGYVGGLVGNNSANAKIDKCSVSGSVKGLNSEWGVGGLVGNNAGTISNSHSSASVEGTGNVGGLAGVNKEHSKGIGTITNSYVSASVQGSGQIIGGLVGTNKGGVIDKSYTKGSVSGGYYVGGLVGYNRKGDESNSQISNNYAESSVVGRDCVGGLVGLSSIGTKIDSCFAIGSVTSETSAVGGLVGRLGEGGSVVNSYYDKETTGQSDIGKGDGRKTVNMINQETFAGWDFRPGIGIWKIDTDPASYPYLQWQK